MEAGGEASPSAVGRRKKQPKKNAVVLPFITWDASHETCSQGEEAGRGERSREQQ